MTQEERAVQIWPLLVWVAKNQQTITYGQIEKLTGLAAVGVRLPLAVITQYCKRKNYQPLAAVVVNGKKGVPGEGLGLSAKESCKALRKVFEYPYMKKRVPQKTDF